MPLHIPPVSRRRFLASTLAAGAGWLSLRHAAAAEAEVDADSWALLADTHLWAKRDEEVHGIKMAEHFERVSGEVRALPRKPAGLFINGDCAYLAGESEDYDLMAKLLAPLSQHGLPIHLAMGNHDHRERFWSALSKTATERPLATRQVSVV